MEVFTTPAALSAWSDARRLEGRRVGLVPTMGALHAAHFANVDMARRHSDVVVVSIFVNPLQFNRADDFSAYPRPIDDDLALCAAHGIDAVYAPTTGVMYPAGFDTHVDPGALGNVIEGAQRPGHYRGVCTVVAKLFGAARPHVAVFGEKDYQQLAIIRRMTTDLDMGIDIVSTPTVREEDGVAMSSRNTRLSADQRAAATCVSRSLRAVARAVTEGERDTGRLVAIGKALVDAEPLARFEHLEILEPDTLTRLTHVHNRAVAVTATWFGDVRLIDNIQLVAPSA